MRATIRDFQARVGAAQFATSSLYSVSIADPLGVTLPRISGGFPIGDLMNFYCESVTTPTKQIATARHKDFGVSFQYPTGTVYGEVTMNFISPANLSFNEYFEVWYNQIHNDFGNQVMFYDDCVSPQVIIRKFEKSKYLRTGEQSGAWILQNALPYNITPYQLSGNRTQLLKLRVSFRYERYRFFPAETDPGWANRVRNNTTSGGFLDPEARERALKGPLNKALDFAPAPTAGGQGGSGFLGGVANNFLDSIGFTGLASDVSKVDYSAYSNNTASDLFSIGSKTDFQIPSASVPKFSDKTMFNSSNNYWDGK